jgi:PadR family transcriptional regulator PadR
MGQPTILKGTLDLLVLRALNWAPMHGFEILAAIERAAGSPLGIDDSALYQALYRLEGRELLETEWGLTDNNRRARYYRLTAAGRAHLKAEIKQWTSYARIVNAVLDASASVALGTA